MKIVFTEFARQELEDAVRFYEIELSGLGIKFKSEVKKSISRIIEHPKGLGLLKEEKFAEHFFIAFLTKFYTPLRKITY